MKRLAAGWTALITLVYNFKRVLKLVALENLMAAVK
jgi:hypothetical protein